MRKTILFTLLFFIAMTCCIFAENEPTLGDWADGTFVSFIVLDMEEISAFESLPINFAFESNPDNLEKVREGFAKGAVKAILIDVKLKNNSKRHLELGHRIKLSGKGDFTLISENGEFQDSANRNEFTDDLSVSGAILTGRRLLNLGEILMPSNSAVDPGGTIRGKLLFLVPSSFKPYKLLVNDIGSEGTDEIDVLLKWQK